MGIRRFEVLVAVAECPSAGFKEPQGSVVGSTQEMIPEVGETAGCLELVDSCCELDGDLESAELGAAARQGSTVDLAGSGRGCVLAHVGRNGGQRLAVKGGWQGRVPFTASRWPPTPLK